MVSYISGGLEINFDNLGLSTAWRLSGFPSRGGLCSMTRPVIRGTIDLPSATYESAKIFREDVLTPLWISWESSQGTKTIKVGSGTNPNRRESQMFSYADPNGHAIKWLSFGAPVGQSAYLDRVCFDAVLAQSYNGNTIKLPSPLSRKNIFSVHAETGQLFLNSPILDYESTKLFSVMISVTDGQLSSFSTVLITVTDVSEPPIAIKRCSRDLSAHACGRVNENSPVGTPIGSTLEIIDQDSKSYFPGKSSRSLAFLKSFSPF
jgi:hypothetical protein